MRRAIKVSCDDSRGERTIMIRNICVYCGSSSGSPAFVEAAKSFGRMLAEAGIGLVFGGGNSGLMGAVARAALGAGGRVTGIIPRFLEDRNTTLAGVQELVVVEDMHTRKRLMFERADAFVALPGGVGTLEELVEQLTWVQIQRHRKPVVIADIDGFWGPLIALIDHMDQQGFIHGSGKPYLVCKSAQDILPAILAYVEESRSGNHDLALLDVL
jgi:uncharacterized protein (TIGR00730 family)